VIHNEQHDYGRAIRIIGKSIDLKRRIGDVKGIVSSYLNISLFHFMNGDVDKAIAYGKEALGLARTFGYSSEWATVLANLGEMYEMVGQYQVSIDHLKRSLRICERLKILPSIASRRIGLAKADIRLGDAEGAERHLREARKIADRINAKSLKAEALTIAADLAGMNRDPGKMRRCAEEALSLFKSRGIKEGEVSARLRVAESEVKFGDPGKALQAVKLCIRQSECRRHLEKALRSAKSSGSPEFEARALIASGDYYAVRGRNKKALECYEEARTIIKAILEGIDDPDLKYKFMEHPDRAGLVNKIRRISALTN
jgi:tetratricopeptide (TPR) repeat protein